MDRSDGEGGADQGAEQAAQQVAPTNEQAAALGRQQHGPQRRRAAPPCELTVESTDGDPEWKAVWAELEAASFDQAWATATNDTGTEWEYRLMTDMHPYHRLEDRLDKAMAAWFACAAACADFWLIRTLHSDLPVQLVRLWQLLRGHPSETGGHPSDTGSRQAAERVVLAVRPAVAWHGEHGRRAAPFTPEAGPILVEAAPGMEAALRRERSGP